MHKALFFTIISTISLHAMKIQKELVTPAPFSFGAPLTFFAQLPDGFWPPLVRIPISPCSIKIPQKDLQELFMHVPGIKTNLNKGHQFELTTAQFIRQQHRDAVRGFCVDLFIVSDNEHWGSDFDVVTGSRIVECKSSARLSQDSCKQIEKHIKMLRCIRQLVKNYDEYSIQCSEKTGNIALKVGQYTISSAWVTHFVLKEKRNPLKLWIATLKELAKKRYTFCSPSLNKCAKKRLKKIKNKFPELEHILISS